ncbi:MAG: hypothetical protein OHK0015_38360 [Chloroflexi bacterium OHK40]
MMRRTLAIVAALAMLGPAAAQQAPPDDPLFAQQWALQRIGAPCVWARTTGNQGVTVAVLDSGVDPAHPDLVQRLRQDGYDFVDDDSDPRDENGHGTHVAGIIAAALGNGEGGAGLAPGVQILPVRVMSAEGIGTDADIASGIDFAVARGARVINLSLGATLLLATPESSPRVLRAVRDALAAGVIVVVAAGNDFVPLPNALVGENSDVLVVAASDQDDRKARFSNSGPWVDVTAPGERILSTMPTYEVYLTGAALPEEERFAQGYDTMSGTSQAAPFVAAVAALLISEHPEWGPDQVREAITASAVDIYGAHPSYYRRLRLLGSGRLDACASLSGRPASPSPLAVLADNAIPVALGASGLLLIAAAATLMRRRRPIPSRQHAAPPVARPGGDTLVATPVPWGTLRLVDGPGAPATFTLTGSSVTIGRGRGCEVRLPDDTAVSRRHARLSLRDGIVLLEDLGSSHGTMLDGTPVSGPAPLRPGAHMIVGQTTLRYTELAGPGQDDP